MKINSLILILCTLLAACSSEKKITKYAQHYKLHADYKSLEQVVRLINLPADTTYIQNILGPPENYGFDYRFYTDSTSLNKCPVGAVFHIDANGKIDSKWIDEICE